MIKIGPAIIFLIFSPYLLLSQSDKTFVDQINECYSDEKFTDIFYRIENEKNCYVGLKFPNFECFDIENNKISNETFKSKVVVINFWFTACPPCVEEIPFFNGLIEGFKSEDVLFLAPSTDDKNTLEQFFKQYINVNSLVIPNSKSLFRNTLASQSGFPTTLVLDKFGVIRTYYSGLKGNEELEDLIRLLLDE